MLSALMLPDEKAAKEALTSYFGTRVQGREVYNAMIFAPPTCARCPKMRLLAENDEGIWVKPG